MNLPAVVSRQPTLIWAPHPFQREVGREIRYIPFEAGESILSYLKRVGIFERMGRQPFMLTIDGRRIPRSLWSLTHPKAGTQINLYALVHGGEGTKKNPLAIISIIALSVFAPQFAGAIAGKGASAMALGLWKAGIMIVGGMIINELFPPPRPDMSAAQGLDIQDSPTYSITGGSNRARSYQPMPKVVGTTKIFPDLGALPYTEFEGEDQILYQVFDFGYNDLVLNGWKIGDTPIENYKGVTLEESTMDGALTLFPGNVDTLAGAALTFPASWIQRTGSADATGLAIEIGGTLFRMTSGALEAIAAEIEMEYRRAGDSTWIPLSFASDSVPETSIILGVARLPNSTYQQGARRTISVQPSNVSGITVLSSSLSAGTGTAYIAKLHSNDFTVGIRVAWAAPGEGNLQQQMGPPVRVSNPIATEGGGIYILWNKTYTANIIIQATLSDFDVDADTYGGQAFTIGAELAGRFAVINSARTPLRRTFKFNVAREQYEVRVRRITPDETDLQAVSALEWSQLRTYQFDTSNYEGRKRVALKIRASDQLQGVVDDLNCVAQAQCNTYTPLDSISKASESDLWAVGSTMPTGYGASQTVAGESTFAIKTGPFGTNEVVNVCIPKDQTTNADGGWTITANTIPVDSSKGHIFALFVKKMTVYGSLYWGPHYFGGSKIEDIGGAPNTNPYFYTSTTLPNTVDWFLVIGYVHPSGYSGADAGISGVYNLDGVKQADGNEFRFAAGVTTIEHRAYHFYNDTNDEIETQYMARPVVIPCSVAQAPAVIQEILGRREDYLEPDWSFRPTSNPGWWYLDVVRGKFVDTRRVWGAGLSDAKIDIVGLQDFASWCDSEKLGVDGVFDQQLSVYDMLSQIALMGRATPSWGTGKLGVVADLPDLPVTAVFGMHNILPGSFSIEYSNEGIAEVIEGWFINPDHNWERDLVRVFVPGTAGEARVHKLEFLLCRSRTQAAQLTNLYAAQNVYRNRRYKWRSDWELMPSARGDVVQLSHDLASMDYSGRLVEGSTTSVLKLPKAVPLFSGGSWITLVEPDGTFATHSVVGGTGTSDTLTLVTPLGYTPSPPYDYKWLYGPTATPGRKVKIESFKPVSEREVEVTAIDESDAFYATKDGGFEHSDPTRPFTGLAVSNLQVYEEGVAAGKGYLVRVIISWDIGPDFLNASLRMSTDGQPYQTVVDKSRNRSVTINIRDQSQLSLELVGTQQIGFRTQSNTLTLNKLVDWASIKVPSDVMEFHLDGNTFKWVHIADVDVVGYIIRFHYGNNPNVGDATKLHDGVIPYSPHTFAALPSGQITFLITAVDAAGLESVNPAIVVRNLGDSDTDNIVETIDFEALSWPGTLTGGTEVGSNLEADAETSFYSPDDGASLYGADADPFYEEDLFSAMRYETLPFSFPEAWVGSPILLFHTIQGEAVKINVRRDSELPFYGLEGDPFYGPDDDPFYGSPGIYTPWTGSVSFESGTYQLEITTAQSNIQGIIDKLVVVIDVPDIEESFNSFTVSPGGTRLPITKDFDIIKTVLLTLEDDGGAAVTAKVIDRDEVLGPLVECFDDALVSTSGTVDATVKGR